MLKVFVGWDKREARAYQVCVRSLVNRSSQPLSVTPVVEEHVRALGMLTRPFKRREVGHHQIDPKTRLFDVLSAEYMSTEFSLARFAVPMLAGYRGWALFCDCDFLWRGDVAELFALADPQYAAMVVKHEHRPRGAVKMENESQRAYPRKNWSSLVLWNCGHNSHGAAWLGVALNSWHRDRLHAFDWLPDHAIGALPVEWNWLAYHNSLELEPKAVHFTEGTPDMTGYENQTYADEWRQVLRSIEGRA